MIIELGKFVLNQPQRFQAAIRVRLCGGDVRSQILSCVINRFQEQANVFVCALEAIEWGFGFVQSNLPVKAAPTTRGLYHSRATISVSLVTPTILGCWRGWGQCAKDGGISTDTSDGSKNRPISAGRLIAAP